MNDHDTRTDAPKRPGFLQRIFGRGPDAPVAQPPEARPESPQTRSPPPAPREGEPVRPASGPAGIGIAPEPPAAQKPGWWNRLKAGLSRSSASIGQGIVDLVTKRKLDATTLEELEDLLIQADLGVATASRITAAVGGSRYEKGIDAPTVKRILAGEVEKVLGPVAVPLAIDAAARPFVVLVVGVNGSGKTTTIGKLAAKLRDEGKSVMLAAGDTFRAAAIEQIKIWGERAGAEVIARAQGADAAGLAFDALTAARQRGADVLLVDTAGRLHNRAELMAELEKIVRVMKKLDPGAPHAVLLVLDATVGQNALNQVEIFGKTVGVTGLVMTKLDGTARGGILVAIAEKFRLPVHFIGVGETEGDLEPFAARDFAHAIAGLDR
ncbi:MAG: signal recognition particle-docking protein FtsY [Methylobacteriaceae bacterium]|nr:signal recognition particle-docking protein FtsY [Methylobacteriaceae bacterium]